VAWRIPDDTINALRDRVSIVDVISNYVRLKKQGRNYLGLCPFHSEKTPSFTVSDERGFYHCFGCGAGGSIFTFLMQQERIEFREAVEMVARRIGFELPAADDNEARAASMRERLTRLNDWAGKRFVEALWGREGKGAREYLESRGVSEEIATRFGLGYAPAAGSFLAGALSGRADALNAAAQLGLVGRRDDGEGGAYDRFRGRVMFPISDLRGSTIAFGGRALGDVQPKYLNSPESSLFHKGEVLYALQQSRDAIRKGDEVIVVEGYLDALALIQFGIDNVAATLGTALTPAHLRVLSRLASRIVVFFDGDNAGRRAAMRGFAVCAESGVWAHGAFLPDGDDPDTFVRKRGAEAVRDLLAQAVPLSDFYFQQVRASGSEWRDRAQAAQEVMQIIRTVADPIERDMLMRTAAARLGVGEEAMRAALRRAPQRAGPANEVAPVRPPRLEPRVEVLLVESMAVDEGIARAVEHHGVIERFRNRELASAAQQLVQAWHGHTAIPVVLEHLEAPIAERLRAAVISADSMEPEERLQLAEDCVRRIEAEAQRPEREAARREVLEASVANDLDRERESLRRIQDRLRQHKG